MKRTALLLTFTLAAFGGSRPATAGVAPDLRDWYLLPAVASAPGQLGTYFRTDVTLVNPYVAHSVPITIWLLKNDQDNSSAPSANVTLRPGETMVLRDIVSAQFGYTGGASLILSSSNALAFGCTAKTYTGTSGTYGFAGTAHYWDNRGAAEAFTSGLRSGNGFRTNLGLVSTSSIPITVEVNIYDTTQKLGSRRLTLPPFGRTQFAASEIAPPFENAYAVWSGTTSSSSASWVPFATVIDNASGDSVYVDDVYDGAFSTREAQYDLRGEWRGTAAWPGGHKDVAAVVSQRGPRVEMTLYNTENGARISFLTGYEDEGTVALSGVSSIYFCRGDSVKVNGSVLSAGESLGLTITGTGCYETATALALQKASATAAAAPANP